MRYVKYKIPFINNLYLLKWYPKAITGIHNHPEKYCDVVIINNSLYEYQYILNKNDFKKINEKKLNASFMYTLPPEIYHDVHNNTNSYVYSLNYYY
uniref:Uncharacterized protein n=1 Tax=viral metagenome TaxID=1070528 RepID=A0A6C0CZF6_9ZZZZ